MKSETFALAALSLHCFCFLLYSSPVVRHLPFFAIVLVSLPRPGLVFFVFLVAASCMQFNAFATKRCVNMYLLMYHIHTHIYDIIINEINVRFVYHAPRDSHEVDVSIAAQTLSCLSVCLLLAFSYLLQSSSASGKVQ